MGPGTGAPRKPRRQSVFVGYISSEQAAIAAWGGISALNDGDDGDDDAIINNTR